MGGDLSSDADFDLLGNDARPNDLKWFAEEFTEIKKVGCDVIGPFDLSPCGPPKPDLGGALCGPFVMVTGNGDRETVRPVSDSFPRVSAERGHIRFAAAPTPQQRAEAMRKDARLINRARRRVQRLKSDIDWQVQRVRDVRDVWSGKATVDRRDWDED